MSAERSRARDRAAGCLLYLVLTVALLAVCWAAVIGAWVLLQL